MDNDNFFILSEIYSVNTFEEAVAVINDGIELGWTTINKLLKMLLVVLLTLLIKSPTSAKAADNNSPADFTISNTIVAPNPERFGANIALEGSA